MENEIERDRYFKYTIVLCVQIPPGQSQSSACSPSWQPALPACALGRGGQEWGRGITPGMWGQGHGQQGDNAPGKTPGDQGELILAKPTCGWFPANPAPHRAMDSPAACQELCITFAKHRRAQPLIPSSSPDSDG